jgi:rhamnosyltransferase
MRMVALVVHRPPSTTLELISTLLELDFFVILWLNSTVELPTHPNLVCLGTGRNVGLSIPFNAFFDHAELRGFHEFLYLDQDAFVSSEIVTDFDKASGLLHTANHAVFQLSEDHLIERPTTVKLVYSNGCVFNVNCPVRHSKDFFVEGVDYDYCLNAARLNYTIGVISSMSLIHSEVQPRRTYYACGYEFVHRPYPIKRHVEFLLTLMKLTIRAFYFTKFDFCYIFVRNIFTHLAVQVRAWFFFTLWRMRLVIKKDENL